MHDRRGRGRIMAVPEEDASPGSEPDGRRSVRAPRCGWVAVAKLGAMLVLVGWVVDQAGLAGSRPGGEARTAMLPVLMLVAGATGATIGASGLRVPLGHLVAVLLGVMTLLVAWTWSLAVPGDSVLSLGPLRDAATRLLDDWVDHRASSEPLAVLLAVGAITWTTGYLAAFGLVRRNGVVASVSALGILLIVVTTWTRVPWGSIGAAAIAFTGLALGLLLRAVLTERRRVLVRHQVRVAPGAEARLLRGGISVGVVALAAAVALQGIVALPPLGSWTGPGLDGPGSPSMPRDLRDRTRISDTWVISTETVLTVRPGDRVGRYLGWAAYGTFDGREWLAGAGSGTAIRRPSGVVGESVDRPTGAGDWTHPVTFLVTNPGPPISRLVAPPMLRSVDRPVALHVAGPGDVRWGLSALEPIATGSTYAVIADVARDPWGPPMARLVGSLDPLPGWVDAYRATVPPSVLDEDARALARTFRDGYAETDAFHVATRMEAWFAGTDGIPGAPAAFRYLTDIRGVCAPDQGVVACLLAKRVGFCQHYATAMTLMLQSLAIPARYVEGYLPGVEQPDGTWVVPASAAHAWVEVFFPAAGWVRFDPTPGGNQRNGQLTTGVQLGVRMDPGAAARATPGPAVPSTGVVASATAITSPGVVQGPGVAGPSGVDGLALLAPAGMLLLLASVSLIGLGVLGARALRRRRRVSDRDPIALYREIVAQAGQVGLHPRSGDTELEFAAAVGRAVPEAAHDVETLAQASVAAVYGRRTHDDRAIEELVSSFRSARRVLRAMRVRRAIRG